MCRVSNRNIILLYVVTRCFTCRLRLRPEASDLSDKTTKQGTTQGQFCLRIFSLLIFFLYFALAALHTITSIATRRTRECPMGPREKASWWERKAGSVDAAKEFGAAQRGSSGDGSEFRLHVSSSCGLQRQLDKVRNRGSQRRPMPPKGGARPIYRCHASEIKSRITTCNEIWTSLNSSREGVPRSACSRVWVELRKWPVALWDLSRNQILCHIWCIGETKLKVNGMIRERT